MRMAGTYTSDKPKPAMTPNVRQRTPMLFAKAPRMQPTAEIIPPAMVMRRQPN